MSGIKHVVRTKIVPPRRRVGLLRRSRLLDFLHENINRKLLLISAAAGYGKTSLLVDFQQDTELTTTWYSMDASDADPWTFTTHLVASLGEAFPSLLPDLESLIPGEPSGAVAPQIVLQQLVNLVQTKIPEYFVILIDDFQHADASTGSAQVASTSSAQTPSPGSAQSPSPAIQELVTWFLDHMPDNCSMILASRSVPDLPYLKLAARQEIAALGGQELAFTPEEIRDYLALNHNLDLPLEEAQRLFEESEGWITGILLGTHSLWKGLLRSLAAARGKEENVFDYLAQEVYDGQPESTRRFLRATSILKSLRPDLCNDLLGIGDAADLLERLEGANMFVTRLSGPESVYRYHALFQEFLQRQFGPGDGDEKSRLHRAAAGLFEREGELEESLEHYLAGGAAGEARRVLKLVMESTYQAGRHETLTGWLAAVGGEEDPELSVMRGRLDEQKGKFDLALAQFEQAREAYRATGDASGEADVRTREALIYRSQGALDKARAICIDVLEGSRTIPLESSTQARAHRILGEVNYFVGDLLQAKRSFRQSLELYERAGDTYQVASLLQALGAAARAMGNPLEAEGHFARAVKMLERLGNRGRVAEVRNNIGVGHYYQGEYEKALEVLEKALADARMAGHRRTEAAVLASLGDVHADLGNSRQAQGLYVESLEGVRSVGDTALEIYVLCALSSLHRADQAWEQSHAWLNEAGRIPIPSGPGYLRSLLEFHRGALLLDQAEVSRAAEALRHAVVGFESVGARRVLARAYLWSAHAHHLLGEVDDAITRLGKALDLAEAIAHPHLLVVDGKKMVLLLEEARRRHGGRREVLSRMLTRIHQLSLSPLRSPGEESPREVRPPKVEIRALGDATVRIDGLPVSHLTWGGPLVRELFFYLVEEGPVRLEDVLAMFWPEYSRAKAQSVFHATLYRMRRALPGGLVDYTDDDGTYAVRRTGDMWYDVAAFEELMRRARSTQEGPLEEALAIYRGGYLGEVYSDWAARKRDELQRMFVEGLTSLAGGRIERGEYGSAADLYRRAVSEEPYREDLHRALMRALAADGRGAEAIRHYHELTDLLRRDLEMRPSDDTDRLFLEIQKETGVRS